MRTLPPRFRDNSSSRIGTYEAFLDLLTLFCFVLMFAAAIYIARPGSNGGAQITAEDAVRGASPGILPQGLVELKIFREGALDKLTVLDGVTGRTTDFDVTTTNVADQLASLEPSLRASSNICIAVFEDTQPVNSEVVLAIQRWLSYSEMGKYQFFFVQPK